MTPRRTLSLCALGCALLLFFAPHPDVVLVTTAVLVDPGDVDDVYVGTDLRVSTYGNGVWERPLLRVMPTAIDETTAAPSRAAPTWLGSRRTAARNRSS